jgi:hypothetical protein
MGFSNLSIDPFFEVLVSRIRRDMFFESPYMWLSCSDPTTPISCATVWARESNTWDCEYVYKKLDNTTDLATSGYTEGAFPIIELQISKAAFRLATWLNKLVDGPRTYKTGHQIMLGDAGRVKNSAPVEDGSVMLS